MSQTIFPLLTTPAIACGGFSILAGAQQSYGGHAYLTPALYAGIDFTFTGTELEVYGYGFGNSVAVSIDGGAYSNIAPASGWAWDVLATGLSDVKHTVSIRNNASNYNWFGICIDPVGTGIGGTFRVTGAAPAIGSQPNLALAANVDLLGSHPLYMDFSPGWNFTGPGQGSYGIWSIRGDVGVRFLATTGVVAIYVVTIGTYNLRVDGVDTAQLTAGTVGAAGTWLIFPGLDNTSPHMYEITICAQVTTAVLGTIAVSGLFNTAVLPGRKRAVFVGDSITQTVGVNGTPTSLAGFPNTLAKSCSLMVCNYGDAGEGVVDVGATIAADVASFAIKPDLIVIEFLTNDMNQGINGDHRTMATVQTAYQAVIASFLTNTPAAIVCLLMLPRTGFTQATIQSWDAIVPAAIAAAEAAAGVGTMRDRITYVDPYTWLTQWTDFQSDEIHPNVATGWPKMAAMLSPLVQAALGISVSSAGSQVANSGVGLFAKY